MMGQEMKCREVYKKKEISEERDPQKGERKG